MTTADDFFREIVADAEKTRRVLRIDGALPGEIHDVNTDYPSISEFCCKHCRAWNRLDPPVYYEPGRPQVIVRCEPCGDLTRVTFHLTA